MDRHPSARHSSVVVLVVELTVIYDITVVRRTSSLSRPAAPHAFTCATTAAQKPASTKPRPVATVRPASCQRNSKVPEGNAVQEIPLLVAGNSKVTKEAATKSFTGQEIKCGDKTCDANDTIFHKSRGKIIVDENCNNVFEASKVITNPAIDENPQENNIEVTPDEKTTLKQTTTNESGGPPKTDAVQVLDLCAAHRDWVRESSRKTQFVRGARKMDGCNGDQGCGEAQGCYENGSSDWGTPRKETPITECLNEFLEELHLTHLADYLRVLGCTCVRDLRLLEKEELNAIQLISRRRLLQQLESVNLHHEAPPPDCSLEGWLTWYGLTHISGFLAAIGVHSVADLAYMKEEDLMLLKPVTRRRILTCNRK